MWQSTGPLAAVATVACPSASRKVKRGPPRGAAGDHQAGVARVDAPRPSQGAGDVEAVDQVLAEQDGGRGREVGGRAAVERELVARRATGGPGEEASRLLHQQVGEGGRVARADLGDAAQVDLGEVDAGLRD